MEWAGRDFDHFHNERRMKKLFGWLNGNMEGNAFDVGHPVSKVADATQVKGPSSLKSPKYAGIPSL